MPQISKIRVVNFQYNDGKRLIADELYDFERENKDPSDVLINLANGGGKSVLVQLIMQPIIPKAKVAGRKIESFFTKATDHCYVVIEWALDNSKMKLMTGIAISASDTSRDVDQDRGFQVKYYTFISSYRDYEGDYNIITLPLSRKENGRFVPAAFDDVRGLARRSGGQLDRYSSDDNSKWQARLSQYGIIQNEWRMIEELNSNEDGLSKYFSSLKTSDAIIDKLIIPRIEEKQNHASSRDDSSLETMLISYARQFSKQQDIIKEREICSGFYEMLELAKADAVTLWESNDALVTCIGNLFAYADALAAEVDKQNGLEAQFVEEKAHLEELIRHIQMEKASAEYYTCKEAYEHETENLHQAEAFKSEATESLNAAKRKLRVIECAYYYGQLKEIEGQLASVSAEIANRENNSESSEKLASLKYSAHLSIKEELQHIMPDIDALSTETDGLTASLAELDRELKSLQKDIEAAASDLNKSEATYDKQKQDNDSIVEELGINVCRMFDGKYQRESLISWQQETQAEEQSIKEAIENKAKQIQEMEARREIIPDEIADVKFKIRESQTELNTTNGALDEYTNCENRIRDVFEKHSLNFELRFSDYAREYISELLSTTCAQIADETHRIESTEEAISAVNRGTLHIPKMLADFLDSTGIHNISVEKYLLKQQEEGTLSSDRCLELLEQYPFAAYGVIVDDTDMMTLYQEADGNWLPSVLPVFSISSIEKLLHGTSSSFDALSAYSKEYFLDHRSYAANLQETLSKQYTYRDQLEERRESFAADIEAVNDFAQYDAKWETHKRAEKTNLENSITESQTLILKLQQELAELKEEIGLKKDEEKRLHDDQNSILHRLTLFEKLLKRLEEEDVLSYKCSLAKNKHLGLKDHQNKTIAEKSEQESQLVIASEKLNQLQVIRKSLEDGLEFVSDAAESSITEGDWKTLLAQYKGLLEAQSSDLKQLNTDKERLIKERLDKQTEIQKRGCNQEEYESLFYTEDLEVEASAQIDSAEATYQNAEVEWQKASRYQARAEASYQNAVNKISELGGEPLPQSEIGKAFDTRISETKNNLNEIEKKRGLIASSLSLLQVTQGKTESIIDQYARPTQYSSIALEKDFAAQLDHLSKQAREWSKTVSENKRNVEDDLKQMASTYGSGTADIHLAISSMQTLLSNTAMRGDMYYTLCEHIDTNMHTVKLRISQIDTDLIEFHKTKGDLIRQCVIQGRQVYEGMLQLSNNSKVKVQEKRRQMIRFDIPESVDENIANAAIAAEIEKGATEIVSKMAEDSYAESDIRKIADRTVGSKRLLRKYIGSENIVLKAYKIDRNPDNSGYRTWEQTQINNSGAEKFVVYFAVILALMAYARDNYDDIDGKNNRSVLVLDNPFGPISSKHVLEPMFEISRNYNVQMICLSDISKSDIVSCFDLVIRAIVKQFAFSNKEQLTHEGNEIIEHGYYRSEQIELF